MTFFKIDIWTLSSGQTFVSFEALMHESQGIDQCEIYISEPSMHRMGSISYGIYSYQ